MYAFVKNRGFTVYFASLVATLTLSIGLVIYDLYSRQLSLGQVTTQSQYAIYAADSGAECALYWDLRYGNLAPSDSDGSAFATSSDTLTDGSLAAPNSGVTCNGQDIIGGSAPLSLALQYPAGSPGATFATSTFWFSMGSAASTSCVKVEISKTGYPSQTTVIAHGYNTCTNTGQARLERTLQVNY